MKRAKPWLKILLAIAMIAIGITHFTSPEGFVKIVPSYLPAPLLLVHVSGFFEILGGLGLLWPRVQTRAAWGLIALYVAVFPANVNMAIHHIQLDDRMPVPDAALWLRLPLQLVLIAWAYWFTKTDELPQRPIV